MRRKSKPGQRKKRRFNSLPSMIERTRQVVHRWVRDRDREHGCICVGCSGGVEHASHYFAAGTYSALRFDVDNIWGSCAKCNTYLHGNLIMYRKGLVDRMGEDFVLKLEERGMAPDSRRKKWSREELEQLINKYRQY